MLHHASLSQYLILPFSPSHTESSLTLLLFPPPSCSLRSPHSGTYSCVPIDRSAADWGIDLCPGKCDRFFILPLLKEESAAICSPGADAQSDRLHLSCSPCFGETKTLPHPCRRHFPHLALERVVARTSPYPSFHPKLFAFLNWRVGWV